MRFNPELRTVRSPYGDGEQLVAMPALQLDVALIHMNRGDQGGTGQFLGVDPYFDDLMCMAAQRRFMSVERIVDTEEFLNLGPAPSVRITRLMTDGVVETPNGAHFTSCAPDYERDEAFQREYAATAKSDEAWNAFRVKYLDVSEAEYQAAVGSAG
jgi:glutaconate CoA-transferase subunit A